MKKTNTKDTTNNLNIFSKPLVYVLLAAPFENDTRVKQEVMTLNENNFYTYTLSWDREGKFKDKETSNNFVKYVKLLTSLKFNKILFLLSAIFFQFVIFFNGTRLLKKWHKMIIHANDFNTLFGVFMLNVVFSKRIKIVYDCHELTPAVYSEWYGYFIGSIMGKIEQKMVSMFDSILTVSPPIMKHLSKISGKKVNLIWNYPTKKILPNKSKEEARKLLNLSIEQFIVVYVGTLRSDIALDSLIDAIAEIRNQKSLEEKLIKVVIVGDGPLYQSLIKKTEDYNLNGMIEIIGRVNRKKSLDYIRAADLSYILFTVKGLNTKIGMPWKLFESLASETQVVVVDDTYAAGFIRKYNAGYVISNITPQKISELLLKMIKENKQSEFKLVNNFLWESQEEAFLTIYNGLNAS